MGLYRLDLDELPETLGALELTSVAVGYEAADKMLKKAPVRLLDARPYSPGKFLILITGGVAAVEEALTEGIKYAGASLFDRLMITQLEPAVVHAINRSAPVQLGESLGIIETFSAVSAIDAANEAVKLVDMQLESVNLLQGLGGKAYAVLTGRLSDVESALQMAMVRIPADMMVQCRLISQVSAELLPFLPGRDNHVFS